MWITIKQPVFHGKYPAGFWTSGSFGKGFDPWTSIRGQKPSENYLRFGGFGRGFPIKDSSFSFLEGHLLKPFLVFEALFFWGEVTPLKTSNMDPKNDGFQ